MKTVIYALTLIALSACSTIIDGPHQTIHIDTDPAGATCRFMNNDTHVGDVVTPGEMRVEKTKYPMIITCSKPGYQDGRYDNRSGVDGVTLGNMIMGGVIGWGVDSATGSDNKYEETVHITLQRK